MSHIIQAQLEIEGYDATTAGQIVKTVEAQTEDVARDYLSDLIESTAVIDRYIRARAKKVPESRKPSAQAAIDKTKSRWPAAASSSPGPGRRPESRPQTPLAGSSRSGTSSPAPQAQQPKLSTHIKQSISNKSGPYTRGGFGVKAQAQAQAQAQAATPSTSSAPKENRQYKIDSIADLDAAIRDLDMASRKDRSRCDCMGSLHGLLEMAPNCLSCGKIICNKEGLGDCTACSHPLIPTADLNEIVGILHDQRDAIVSSMGKNALKAVGIDPSTRKSSVTKAQENLDRLLGYQASEALRTKIIDHAEDFETPDVGTNQWASPLEQARQLRNQQRKARKQNEMLKIKRGQGKKVVSIAIRGNKIVQEVSDLIESDDDEEPVVDTDSGQDGHAEPEAVEYWDPKKHGSKYVAPEYTPSPNLKLNSQVESRDVVAYTEQDAFMV